MLFIYFALLYFIIFRRQWNISIETWIHTNFMFTSKEYSIFKVQYIEYNV